MQIRTDITGLNMINNYRKSNKLLEEITERLSSGKKLNKADDNSAGIAISTRMTSQIRGKNQSLKNLSQGSSMLQTAESGAGIISNILQRMRELAIQSSNDTLSSSDRENLDNEFQQLKTEIDHIAKSNNFNGIRMLAEPGCDADPAVIEELEQKVPLWIDDALTEISNNLGISFPNNRDMYVKFYTNPSESRAAYMKYSGPSQPLELGLNLSKLLDANGQVYQDSSGGQLDTIIAHEIVHALEFEQMSQAISGIDMWAIEGLAMAVQGGNSFLATKSQNSDASITNSWSGDYGSAFAAVKTLHEITSGGIQAVVDRLESGETLDQAIANTTQLNQGEFSSGVVDFTDSNSFENWFNTSSEVDNYLNSSTDFTLGEGAILTGAGSSDSNVQPNTITNNTTIENPGVFNLIFDGATSDPIKLHKDYEHDDVLNISTYDLTSGGLGISSNEILTNDSSQAAISMIDKALNNVSGVRVNLGAIDNRLKFAMDNLSTSTLNTTKARSRLEDADISFEISELTKQKILMQTSMSLLAQNNQKNQNILTLLNN